MSQPLKIGITGTGSLIGQAIIKCIQRSGIKDRVEIIGFDYFPNSVGSFWIQKNYILPDILKPTQEQAWLDALCDVIIAEGLQLLFIGVDFELRLASKYQAVILERTACHVLVSDERVISIADDKYLTYKFLKDNGLYYPKTYLADDDKTDLTFPCIIKPRIGARSRGVYKVQNSTELAMRIAEDDNPVIQEMVGTDQTEYTCGVIFLDNEVKAMIALRRSLKEGNTNTAEYTADCPPIIYTYLKAVCAHLKPNGCCNFQLRLDAQGIPKIFEINSRHSGTTFMRSLFGFNEIEYIISYMLDKSHTPFVLHEGTVIRYFEEFFVPKTI